MKMYSWNVNGIRAAHKKGFLDWVAASKADVIMIQETKADEADVPKEIRELDGYHTYWHSCSRKKGYSGVGVLTRTEPTHVNTLLACEEFDCEGRVLEFHFGDTAVYNIYFPNGGRENSRVPFKLSFYANLFARWERQRAEGKKIIVAGDYNIAHKEIDLARPKANEKTTGFLPEERALLDDLAEKGWLDSFREYHPDEPEQYSYWDQITRARERNVGWRIDYHWMTPDLAPSLKNAWIEPDVMGSDHCPVGIVVHI